MTPRSTDATALDQARLAVDARTALCAATRGVLALTRADADPTGATFRVGVQDDEGEALVLCRPHSVVELAARGRHPACLTLDNAVPSGPRVKLGGRLALTDGDGPGRPGVALRVERVDVGCPDPRVRRRQAWRSLSLATYGAARPDPLRARLPRLVRHLNRCHADALRSLAAHHAGTPVGAAGLTRVDSAGVVLAWVDDAGGDEVVISFPSQAITVEDVSTALREVLGTP